MTSKNFLLLLALAGASALAGCQSNMAGREGRAALAPGVASNQRDVELGQAQFREGNYGLAERHFRAATQARSGDAEAWMGLAASYDRLGQFDRADRAYGELLKRAGRRPEIINNLGYSHLLRGEIGKARELLSEARAGLADRTLVDANLKLLGS